MISLTKNQLTGLIMSMILIRLYLSLPREILMTAGNAAWILIIYITSIALVLFFFVTKVYKRNESILDIAEDLGGKTFKIITGIISVALLLIKTSGHIKLFIESIQIVLLQNTATELIVLVLGIALVIGAYSGIESLVIISGLFLPVVVTVLVSFIVLLVPVFNLDNLIPILGTGLKPIFTEGLRILSVFADLFLLTFLLPYCKEKDALKKSGFFGIVFNGIVFLIFMVGYCAVFPYPVSSEYIIPIFQLTRIVEIGDFFGRFEAFFEFIWAISFLIYASINIWVLSIIWQKTFDIKYHEPIIIPMTVFSLGIGFLQPSMLDIINGNRKYSWLLAGFAFFVPFIFGFLSKIRHKE